MIFVNSNSKVWIADNTGVSKIRSIMFYDKHKAKISDLFVGSISRVKPRRKIKKGQWSAKKSNWSGGLRMVVYGPLQYQTTSHTV